MTDQESTEFKISVDDEVPESVLGKKPSRPPRPPIPRAKRRGSLLPFLLFIILAIGIGYGYMDIRDRILGIKNAGNQMTETIAGDLHSKFSTLSVKSAKLEEGLNHLSTDLEQNAAAMNKRSDTLQKAIDSLQTDSQKARSSLNKLTEGRKLIEDKTVSLSRKLDKMEASMGPLQQAVTGNREAYEADHKRMSKALSGLRRKTRALTDAMGTLEKANVALSQQVTRLGKVLKEQQEKSDRSLNQSVEKLAAQLQALKEDLHLTGKGREQSGSKKEAAPIGAMSPNPAKLGTTPTAETGRSTSKTGQFTEQNIQ